MRRWFTKTMLLLPLLALVSTVMLSGCKDKKKTSKDAASESVVKVISHQIITRLYYKGTLDPIRSIPVKSPVDGLVESISFKYGETVKKNQKLIAIKATGLAEKYRQAVSDYLQKKAALETQIATYDGDKALYKAQVISKNDFNTAANTYATSVLNLSQSRIALEKVLAQANIDFRTIEGLRLGQTKAVDKILMRTFTHVLVRSPTAGVVLIPVDTKSDSSNNSKSNTLTTGSSVKALQPILSIGDLTGYEIKLQVSELNITQIKVGLKAVITGDSFPGVTLHGVVKQVAVQADPNATDSSSGASSFDVLVDVPNVSQKARNAIRVGMTSKVEVQIKRPSQLMVPIDAVISKGGSMVVTVVDPSGKRHNVKVITGDTTQDNVVIVKGLKAGQRVVVYHKARANDNAKAN